VEVESKEVKTKSTAKLLTPSLKGASHEGENERESRRQADGLGDELSAGA